VSGHFVRSLLGHAASLVTDGVSGRRIGDFRTIPRTPHSRRPEGSRKVSAVGDPRGKVVLDCDTGVDDAFAVLYAALTSSADLVALASVWGNTRVEQAARNNLSLIDLVDCDVPVAVGAAGPVNGGPALFAPHVHGDDGQGGHARPAPPDKQVDPRPAPQLIVDLGRERPGEIDLVAVGPLSNLALALQLDPDVAGLYRSLTIMGGAANVPGNTTAVAEANIWHDPEAADAVFAASWPITLVPLDVTMRQLTTETHRAQLAAGGPVGRYLAAISDLYFGFNAEASFDVRCSPMHDALAVAIAMGSLEVTRSADVSVVVDTTDGPGRGQTICDTRQRYRDYSRPTGSVRLVLDVAPGFPDALIETLSV
jgi:purine nucleosidase